MTNSIRPRGPHDAFFKYMMAHKNRVVELLKRTLPTAVSAELDFTTARFTHESYIDPNLESHILDLVIELRRADGELLYISILLEHKSHLDRGTGFQLLRYMTRIQDQRYRQNLPFLVVIPLVLYHGASRWDVPLSFRSLVPAPPALRGFLPEYDAILLDIGAMDESEFVDDTPLIVYFLIVRATVRRQLREALNSILAKLLRGMVSPSELPDLFLAIFAYLLRAQQELNFGELSELFTKYLSGTREEVAMENAMQTIADELIQKGELQGFEKGEQIGLEKGQQIGLEKGELIGSIVMLRKVRGLSELDRETLRALPLEALRAQFAELSQASG